MNGTSNTAERLFLGTRSLRMVGNVHWNVPRRVNPLFTGRSGFVTRARRALIYYNEVDIRKRKLLVITGKAGTGKSEVCLKIAECVRSYYWGVFWVDVSTPSNAKNGFLTIARAIESPGESIEEVLQALMNTPGRWLLVLDNADDPQFDYAAYIPSSTRGVVFMTSRVPECSKYSTLPVEVLEGLDEEDSTELLLEATRALAAPWNSFKEQAQTIVQLVGSHPVALIRAGTFVADGYCQLDQYAEIYKRLCTQPLEYCPMQQQPRYQKIYAVFEASVEALRNRKDETGRDALELLGVLSMLHFDALPLVIFRDAWTGAQYVLEHEDAQLDDLGPWHVSKLPGFIDRRAEIWFRRRLNEASNLLTSLSLVTRQSVDDLDGLRMDPLVHKWSKSRLNEEQRQTAWVHAGCVLILSRNQSNMWRTHEMRLRSHIQSFLEPSVAEVFSFGPPGTILAILLECGWILDSMNEGYKLDLLLTELYRVLDVSPWNASREHMGIWDLTVNNLLNKDYIQQAIRLLKQVVEIKKSMLKGNHPSLLASQYMLADLYLTNQQNEEAIRLLEYVVKVEPVRGEYHHIRLAPHQALALAYIYEERTEEAMVLLEDIVKLSETLLVIHAPPSRLRLLADTYRATRYIKKTISLLREIVALEESALGKEHHFTSTHQHALATVQNVCRHMKEAVEVGEHVIKIKMTPTTSQHALAYAYRIKRRTRETARVVWHVPDSTDLESVLSLDMTPSLTSGTTISDTSGIAKNAAQQFFEILISDDIMQPLFPVVVEKAGLEKFKRNFQRLLTRYAIDLKAEAQGHIQAGAARLVWSRANYIVHLIAERIEPNEVLALPETEISETDKDQILELYLQGQVQQTQKHHEPDFPSFDPQSSVMYPKKPIDEGEEVGEDHELDEDYNVDEPGNPTLTNLDEVKRFMVQSEAYKELRGNFHRFVCPVEEVINTESQPSSMTVNAANTPYRLHWTCTCGHKGYDSFEETIPGAVTKLAQLLQANGIQSCVEPEPSNSGTFKLHRSYLAIRNMVNRHIKAVGSFLHIVFRPHTSQPATSVSTGLPGSTNSLPATSGGQTTAQSTNPVTNVVSQLSNAPGLAQATATQCQQPAPGSRNDYMLLCAHDQRWLATREDLDVAQIKSDRELFESFQSRMIKRRSQMCRVFSLKTVQSISFVKFALRQDQEVDLLEPNEIPPPIEQHYDFNERNPGRIPPIGNDYLMHRFSNSVHCRDSTFCLDQIPKRTGCRPQMGSKPDGFTGWGLYFEESLDMFRFFLWGMAMFLVSLIFGVAWAASKQSVQDGFAVASYILALEAFTMGTVQAAIAFKMI